MFLESYVDRSVNRTVDSSLSETGDKIFSRALLTKISTEVPAAFFLSYRKAFTESWILKICESLLTEGCNCRQLIHYVSVWTVDDNIGLSTEIAMQAMYSALLDSALGL